MPGESRELGILSGVEFLGKNLGIIRKDTFWAPEGKAEKVALGSAFDNATSSEPLVLVVKLSRKAIPG